MYQAIVLLYIVYIFIIYCIYIVVGLLYSYRNYFNKFLILFALTLSLLFFSSDQDFKNEEFSNLLESEQNSKSILAKKNRFSYDNSSLNSYSQDEYEALLGSKYIYLNLSYFYSRAFSL